MANDEKELDKETKELTPAQIRDWILSCRDEADEARRDRMNRNKNNFDMFHLKHDFSHKKTGQSMEILSKQSMAVETTRSFFQQALASLSDWWSCEATFPDADATMKVRPAEITKLTNHMLEEALYYSHVGNSVESALLGSLVISKCGGRRKPKPRYIARKKGRGKSLKRWIEKTEDQTWVTDFKIVRQENYYPDPTNKGLYELEDSWIDAHELYEMAEYDEDFDTSEFDSLIGAGIDDAKEAFGEARETGQNTTVNSHRPKVKITEFWGTILHPTTGKVCYENCQAMIANDRVLILAPRPNPLWHQKSPYTASPLLEVANSVWHKALMDAPTQHNRALIEIYNLMVDAAMGQVHAISQIRKDWLDNPAQISDGIKPGQAIGVNSMCPPGGKAIEPVSNIVIPPEVFNVMNIQQQEFNAAALTSDIRSGMTPSREQKATAIVEQSQTITSVFQGMATNYEGRQVLRELQLAWETTAQNWDLIDREVFITLFGAQRGDELYHLSPEEVFASTVNGVRFRVYGVSQKLARSQDFRKLTTLLQTISASPQLLEEFMKKYDLGKTLGQIMSALDIDKYSIEIPKAVQATMQPQPEQGQPQQGPQDMTQVPQAGAMSDMINQTGPQIPSTQFPGSPALVGGNQ